MADPEERPPVPHLFLDQTEAQGNRKIFGGGGGRRPPPPLNSRSGSGTVFLKLWNILVFFGGLFILDFSMSDPHARSTLKNIISLSFSTKF